MNNLETIKKKLAAAEKAKAEMESLVVESRKKVSEAQEALDKAKEEHKALLESLGLNVRKGRPVGSKNKPKQESVSIETPHEVATE